MFFPTGTHFVIWLVTETVMLVTENTVQGIQYCNTSQLFRLDFLCLENHREWVLTMRLCVSAPD